MSTTCIENGVFTISGVSHTCLEKNNAKCDRPYLIYGESTARKAGALLGNTLIDITAPELGEWPLFMATQDIDAGQWIISNDRTEVLQVTQNWQAEGLATVSKLLPGIYVRLTYMDGKWQMYMSPRTCTLMPKSNIDSLSEAISVVEGALCQSVRSIAESGKPVMLLLSAGVDSGLLCALLAAHGANFTALSIRTPWGDELEGAKRTAESAGVPLVTLDLTEDEIIQGVADTLRWLQHDDPQIVLIQLLVTIAHRYASDHQMDLVTGMGSDLLNSVNETGMENKPVESLIERITDISASGLLQTNSLGSIGQHRIHHPYWQAATIQAQLAVCDELKSSHGYEKFYLRQLAARRLPQRTAFGEKTAIHQGSNLQTGLSRALSPHSLESYIADAWTRISRNAA